MVFIQNLSLFSKFIFQIMIFFFEKLIKFLILIFGCTRNSFGILKYFFLTEKQKKRTMYDLNKSFFKSFMIATTLDISSYHLAFHKKTVYFILLYLYIYILNGYTQTWTFKSMKFSKIV